MHAQPIVLEAVLVTEPNRTLYYHSKGNASSEFRRVACASLVDLIRGFPRQQCQLCAVVGLETDCSKQELEI